MNEAGKLGSALAAVGVASRMIGQEKNEALLQGSKAHEENIVDQAEAKALEEDKPTMEGVKDLADDNYEAMTKAANATFADPKATPEQRLSAATNAQKALDDKTAAQRALDELNTKLEATQERLARQEKAMARGRKWGGAY